MNIALLIENLVGGGSERVVQRLAIGLARRGHDVWLYCLREAGRSVEHLTAAGVPVREARSYGRDLPLAWRLGRWLRQDRIHIAHTHSCAALTWAFPAARLTGIPIVHVRHGALLGGNTLYTHLATWLDHFVDRLVICAEADRAALPSAGLARRAVHVPNGVDLDVVPRSVARASLERLCGRPLAGPVVLSVATICPEKDTVGLLKAFAAVRRRFPDATLVCVGADRGDAYHARVRKLRQDLELEDHALLVGAAEDAWRLMAGADAFCLSSVTEAMPNVVIEAMSQSVPIVATAVGDVGRIGQRRSGVAMLRDEDTALLVPPGDTAALSAALCRVLGDPASARARASRAARVYAGRYTAGPMAEKYERVYETCLRRRGQRAVRPRRAVAARRPRVLMVGPPPGQIGGMTSVIDSLMASSLRQRCTLHRFSPFDFVHANPLDADAASSGRAASVGRHWRALCRLARAITATNADIVHLHTCSYFSFYRSLLDAALARLLRRRVLLHIHGAKFEEFCSGSGRWARRLIRRGCERVDAVVVLSDDWQRRLRPHLGTANIGVVPNGVPLPAERSDANSGGSCRFLFLGELTKRKGVRELIDAADALRDRGVPFELTLAGPRAEREPEDWPERVRSLALDAHVRFAGPVQGAAKDDLLARSDCLVLPSHNEGLPMALLEAAAAGLAVIATTVGGIPGFLRPDEQTAAITGAEHIAPLTAPGDTQGLAHWMETLARDPATRARVGESVRCRVMQGFTIEHAARRLERLYRRTLDGVRDAAMPGPDEILAERVTYPLHESLRGRATLHEACELGRIAVSGPEYMQELVQQRLRDLLAFAAARLPFYAELFGRHGVDPLGDDPLVELRKLPLLDKAVVRANADRMIWRDVPGGPQPLRTGGTTGDTLHFFVDRIRQAQDLGARLFMQGLFGVPPGARRLYLWGSPIECGRTRVSRWRDRLINEVLLNAFDMSPAQMDAHLVRILRFRPRVIYGYPTAVALLAQHAARRHGRCAFPWLRLAVLTGEEVTQEQVAQVREALRCAVASEYGNREVGLIAHQCPRGALHVVAPHLLVEVCVDGRPADAGQVGEIVCTTLNTRAQPFIRYRLGDAGTLLPERCACGAAFPLLRLAGGKVTGFIALPGGRLCHGAVSTHMLRDEPGITEFRTLQHRLDWIEVLLVVDERFDHKSLGRIRQRYHRLFGPDIRVDCRIVDRIPPDPSGKRRHVISAVAPECNGFEIAAGPDATAGTGA